MEKEKMVKRLVYLSFLAALNVVFTRLFSFRVAIGGVEGVRLGIGGLPVIMAGILFGPLSGALVGAVGDVAGFLISPMGAYMPHFTLTAALTGLIPGLLLKTAFSCRFDFWRILVAVSIGQVTTSVVLVPYFLNMLFGMPYASVFWPALVGQLISIPLYASFIVVLSQRLVTGGVLSKPLLYCE